MSGCDWVVDASGPYYRGEFRTCHFDGTYSTPRGMNLCYRHQDKIIQHVCDMIESDTTRRIELDPLLAALIKRTALNARGKHYLDPDWADHRDAIDAEIERRITDGDAPSAGTAIDDLIREHLTQKWGAA